MVISWNVMMKRLPPHLMQSMDCLLNQMPGYFLWKDINSVYLKGNEKTAKLFGFNTSHQLEGITDYQVKCAAADFAHLFVAQDEKLKHARQIGESLLILDVHPYVNGELKTLLIEKSFLQNEFNHPLGIACYCIELTNTQLTKISMELAKEKMNKAANIENDNAIHFYLNDYYSDINLSERQSQCLFYLIRGKSAKKIAAILNLSPRTVEGYIEHIKAKLKVSSREELIEKSIHLGFLQVIPKGIVFDQLDKMLF
jgi:DNA-binding CsgD family transcriptional regulator